MAPIERPEVALPALELPSKDGVPLEMSWRRIEINLLIESRVYHRRDREELMGWRLVGGLGA